MSEEIQPLPYDPTELDRGVALVNAGEAEAGIVVLDKILVQDARCAKALCGRGTALRQLGRYDESLRDYEAALSIDPYYARAHFNRGLTRFELGETEIAFGDFEYAMSLEPEPAFFFHRAQCLVRLERHPEAISDFTACIQRDDSKAATFFHRGTAYAAIGDPQAAIADFERAILLDVDHVQAYAWLASQWAQQNEHDRAVATLDQAISRSPTDPELIYRRGYALCSSRDYESAVRDLSKAIGLGADAAEHFHWRGRAWEALDDFESAIADQNTAIAKDGAYYDAYLARGRVSLELDDPSSAIADFTTASHLKLAESEPYERRALAHTSLEDDRRAMADLDRALELNPKSKRGLRARSQLHIELGNHVLAEADLDALAEVEEEALKETSMTQRQVRISLLLAEHFDSLSASDLAITERQFPFRVRADLQRATDQLFDESVRVSHFCGVKKEHAYEGVGFSDLLFPSPHSPALAVPAQYEEVDVGESEPIRCLKNGLWLLEQAGLRFAVFLTPSKEHGRSTGIQFQIAAPRGEEGARTTQEVFRRLEEAVLKSQSYRGKILSLEIEDRYSGTSSGIRVHKLRTVERSQVILPAATVELLDRNIIQFARQRARLSELGLSTKKGVLFYGPPGTGKTHTIHYLAGAMQGHTTLLITAEQVGMLSEYMTLARLLQPSIVVIEDADLIARDRANMESVCEEVLLNKLLNEMDGLRPDTDVFFILTTNRPEALEAALASRPGRIDQAIEFPLPDDEGRRKLVRLYSKGLTVPDDVVETAVRRTDRVSASFIKELMRRAAQFQLERDGEGALASEDLERALEELLFAGGTLNCRLLGLQRDEG